MLGWRVHLVKNAVNAVTHFVFVLEWLEMYVGGLVPNRLKQYEVKKFFDGI